MSGGLNDLDIAPVAAAVQDLIDEFVAGRSSALPSAEPLMLSCWSD
jgi:hypothetical protein